MAGEDFKSIIEIITAFPTEKSCIEHLEEIRWNNNVISPFDENSKEYKCKNNRFWCSNIRKYFNVKTRTIFEKTKIPLKKWFITIYFETSHKKVFPSIN